MDLETIEEVLYIEQVYVADLVHWIGLLLCKAICFCFYSTSRSIEASWSFLAGCPTILWPMLILIICKNAERIEIALLPTEIKTYLEIVVVIFFCTF